MLYLSKKWRLASFWVPISFFLCFFYIPISFFLYRYFSLFSILSFFQESLYLKILWFTFKEAFLSSFFTIILSLPGAYLVARTYFRGRNFFLSLSLISFIMPGMSVAIGFSLLFGKNGFLNTIFGLNIPILYTFWAIILAHIFYNFALSIRIIGSQWEGIPISYEDEAKIQGANGLQVFYFVNLPYLLSSILSAFLIIFIYSFMSFAVVLVLGGIRYVTLEVEIYMYLTKLINFQEASKLVWVQFLILLFFTYLVFLTKKSFNFEYEKELASKKYFPLWGYAYFGLVIILIFLPMFSMFIGGFWDFVHHRLTFLWFSRIFSGKFVPYVGTNLLIPIWNTFKYAIFSASIVLLIVTIGSFYEIYKKKYNNLFSLIFASSLFISPITLGFSYIYMNSWVNLPPKFLIIISHTLIALPIAMQIFFEGRESISFSLREAAFIDGANIFTTFFKIELPLLEPYLISTISISMAISMGEIGATLLLYDAPENMSIPVAMVRLLSARRLGEAQAYSTLLFLFAFLLFFVTDYFLRRTSK